MSDEEITHIVGVSELFFSEMRHAATGAGWVVGASFLKMGDGRVIPHAHWAFATQDEAEEQARILRGKML